MDILPWLVKEILVYIVEYNTTFGNLYCPSQALFLTGLVFFLVQKIKQ